MAVSIRMRRAGAKKNAFFHVVATDVRSPIDGRYIEKLGHYDPMKEPPVFQLDHKRLEHWLSRGAKASATVSQLIKKYGVKGDEDKEPEPVKA